MLLKVFYQYSLFQRILLVCEGTKVFRVLVPRRVLLLQNTFKILTNTEKYSKILQSFSKWLSAHGLLAKKYFPYFYRRVRLPVFYPYSSCKILVCVPLSGESTGGESTFLYYRFLWNWACGLGGPNAN